MCVCVCVCVCVWAHAQSCLTLCDPMGGSPPGFSIHGISQARILEWVPFPPPGDKVISLIFNFLGKFYIHSDYDSSKHPHTCAMFVYTHTVLDKHTLSYLRAF